MQSTRSARLGQGLVTAVLQQQQQKAGVPNALLWNVQPTAAQGATDKYTLTPQIMRSIMDQYPAVELAYKELVPDKVRPLEEHVGMRQHLRMLTSSTCLFFFRLHGR